MECERSGGEYEEDEHLSNRFQTINLVYRSHFIVFDICLCLCDAICYWRKLLALARLLLQWWRWPVRSSRIVVIIISNWSLIFNMWHLFSHCVHLYITHLWWNWLNIRLINLCLTLIWKRVMICQRSLHQCSSFTTPTFSTLSIFIYLIHRPHFLLLLLHRGWLFHYDKSDFEPCTYSTTTTCGSFLDFSHTRTHTNSPQNNTVTHNILRLISEHENVQS